MVALSQATGINQQIKFISKYLQMSMVTLEERFRSVTLKAVKYWAVNLKIS